MMCLVGYFKSNSYISLLLLLLLPTFQNLFGQNTGLILDGDTYRSFPLADRMNAKDQEIPSKFSLKKYCPYPKPQGRVASCVGWAVGYSALTISEAQKYGRHGITDRAFLTNTFAFSASFIYNQVKSGSDCRSGARLDRALKFLETSGDCSVVKFPNSSINCSNAPTQEATQEARSYRINSPTERLFDSDESEAIKIKLTKVHLYAGSPVIVGFNRVPGSGADWENRTFWEPHSGEKNSNNQGHAMTIIGYDDGKEAFELMNSFGSNWGQGGFIWISYQDFARYASQSYIIENKTGRRGEITKQPPAIPIVMEGSVEVEYLDPLGDYVSLTPSYNSKEQVYEISKRHWPLDQDFIRFKIAVPMGRHVQLISIDENNKASALWEMDAPAEDTVIVHPAEGAYNFLGLGKEYLCLLYSYEKIPDIKARIQRVSVDPGPSVRMKIQNTFAGELLKNGQIEYDKQKSSFGSRSELGEGTTVALLLSMLFEE